MRHLPAAAQRRMRWKNDGGWTIEIARAGAADLGPDEFRWRVSIAEIESDGPFSAFPGIERDLLLLAGNGMELEIDGASPQRLHKRFDAVHFPGETPVACRLLDGPTRDFNVMARRDRTRAEVWARPLVDSILILPESGTEWLVHVFSGQAIALQEDAETELSTGDSLLLDWRTERPVRTLFRGAGELLMVRLQPST